MLNYTGLKFPVADLGESNKIRFIKHRKLIWWPRNWRSTTVVDGVTEAKHIWHMTFLNNLCRKRGPLTTNSKVLSKIGMILNKKTNRN